MRDNNLLVVYLDFPTDPAQSFPALILKYLVRLGWSVTVVVFELGDKPKEVLEDWSGIQFLRITPPLNLFQALSLRLDSKRSRDMKALQLSATKNRGENTMKSPYRNCGLVWAAANTVLNPFGKYSHLSRYAGRVLMKIHKTRPFSAVMSVYYGPFTSQLVARQFAKESHLPWVALVKDYWSASEYSGLRVAPPALRVFVSFKFALRRRMEAKVLRDADILLPHCQPVADYLRTFVPGAQMRILSNCYDEEDFNEDVPLKVSTNGSIFTALCLGQKAIFDRLDMLFDALSELRISGKVHRDDFRLRFVGAEPKLIRSYAEAYSCSDLVDAIPVVSHKEAISLLKQASCLLFPNRSHFLPRRTPEYMAARKPVLGFPWDETSASQQVLEMYGGATFARNSCEIATTLYEWYRAFRAGNSICTSIQEPFVQSYKASNRALELQEILSQVLKISA